MLSRLLIRADVWNALCTLQPTQQGLTPPPGRGREVCLYRIYALQPAGLLRILDARTAKWRSVSDSDGIVAGIAFYTASQASQYLHAICMLRDNWPVILTGVSQ